LDEIKIQLEVLMLIEISEL